MLRRPAFTLIELLIVVAIIAILAAIAVPNFLEAQMRAKVSRTQTDMRTVAVAIESYKVDTNRYPAVVDNIQAAYSLPAGYDSGTRTQGMTTPVAYITSIPLDPFGAVLPNDPYTFGGTANIADNYYYKTKAYAELEKSGKSKHDWFVSPRNDLVNTDDWVLLSKGPDKYYAPPDAQFPVLHVDMPYLWGYDSTNGTVSLGNIIRSGP
jgi:type II secretion system protein G